MTAYCAHALTTYAHPMTYALCQYEQLFFMNE